MNRGMVDSVSALSMAQLAAEELKYSADAKVAKALLNILQPEEKKISDVFTPEQDEFLKAHGITSKWLQPTAERKLKPSITTWPGRSKSRRVGFSSFPKLSDVLQRQNRWPDPNQGRPNDAICLSRISPRNQKISGM